MNFPNVAKKLGVRTLPRDVSQFFYKVVEDTICNVTFTRRRSSAGATSDEAKEKKRKEKKRRERRALGEDDEGRCRGFGKRDRVWRDEKRAEARTPKANGVQERHRKRSWPQQDRGDGNGRSAYWYQYGKSPGSARRSPGSARRSSGRNRVRPSLRCASFFVLPPIVTGRRFTRVINPPTNELLPPPPNLY